MERAIAIAVHAKRVSPRTANLRLAELSGLVAASGGLVVDTFTQARDNPELGLGRGAADQLCELMAARGATLAVLDQEFRPSVELALQNALGDGVRVLDRTQVILDIFANRARTREARVQVGLAQYEYLEPRLRGRGGLSRLGGGIGTRGPGETRLELDRRIIRRRMAELKHELGLIEKQRNNRRERRGRTELPLIALAGYTNVGKSTLFASLTHRDQQAADALFVTLDSTVRRIMVPGFGPALIADTVGFVDNLPPGLVAAFRSTLAEIRDADLIVDVVSGDSDFPVSPGEQMRVVREATASLGCDSTPRLTVISQADRGWPRALAHQLGALLVSGLTGHGMDDLWRGLSGKLAHLYRQDTVQIGWEESQAWRVVYGEFQILSRHDDEAGARLVLLGPERAFWLLGRVREQEPARRSKAWADVVE